MLDAPTAEEAAIGQLHGPVLSRVLAGLGVQRLSLHGSRAKGTARPDSDFDFMAEFFRPITKLEARRLKELLQDVFGAPVNVCSPNYTEPDFILSILPHCIPIWPRT